MTALGSTIILKKDGKFSLEAVLNAAGHYFYFLRFKGSVIWYFKAYKYKDDGITSEEISAPYGLSEKDYGAAMQKILSFYKVA